MEGEYNSVQTNATILVAFSANYFGNHSTTGYNNADFKHILSRFERKKNIYSEKCTHLNIKCVFT